MGDRLDALETQMGDVTTTLQALAQQMQQHAQQMQQQSLVLTELSKQIGQKATETQKSERSVEDHVDGESCLAGKKVKLPVYTCFSLFSNGGMLLSQLFCYICILHYKGSMNNSNSITFPTLIINCVKWLFFLSQISLG